MTTTEFATSLRELADFYEQHHDLPIPYDFETPMFVFLYGKEPEDVKAILRSIGSFKKQFNEPTDGSFDALKAIGSITLRFHCAREAVCTRRVVGTRTIESYIIPQKIVPASEEEIVEWDCEPILGEVPA